MWGKSRAAVSTRLWQVAGLALLLGLMQSASALAAGKAVNIASPLAIQPPGPSVAVDSAGNALIAWANDEDQGGSPDLVQYCVLAAGGSSCLHSGTLTPAGSMNHVDAVRILADGGTLVLVADVYGVAGVAPASYAPVQEWQSTDDGASWTVVAGGVSVSDGIINADTVPVDAVILPGTGQLGFGWVTASGPPTFNAFPLTNPPECSTHTCPAGYATLEPSTNPDQLSNEPGHFVSDPVGSGAGVFGVFDTVEANGPLGCAGSFGTAYVYGSGAQSPANNYNVSPGQPNTAWRVPVTQAACGLEYSAAGAGPAGFGVLADDLSARSVVYQRFDASTGKFAPLVTVNGSAGELYSALSQDAGGGIYGTYLLGGSLGKVELSYSADAGAGWTSAPLDTDSAGTINDINSSVNATGQGWLAWLSNGSVFAQSFEAADAVAPASVGSAATSNGSTLTVDVTCSAYPCTITLTLTAPETVVINAHSTAVAAKKHKPKTVTLGKGKFTIAKSGKPRLTVKLTRPGKRFLAARKGQVKVSGLIGETVQKQTTVTKRTLTLKLVKAHNG